MNLATYLASSTSGIGVFGALVGGAGAAAKNIKDSRDGLVTPVEAVVDTSKEAAGAGVATVVSAVSVGAAGVGLGASLGIAAVTAIGAKYLWDRSMEQIESRFFKGDMDQLDHIVASSADEATRKGLSL
ncbi:magnetic particle protein [Ectothiorhodospiraceae bacterium BW-2]|nr:magnetic particle protein [Ectothiorhodospiraceae bacterium BW-2]